jgi:hypothetical protein
MIGVATEGLLSGSGDMIGNPVHVPSLLVTMLRFEPVSLARYQAVGQE